MCSRGAPRRTVSSSLHSAFASPTSTGRPVCMAKSSVDVQTQERPMTALSTINQSRSTSRIIPRMATLLDLPRTEAGLGRVWPQCATPDHLKRTAQSCRARGGKPQMQDPPQNKALAMPRRGRGYNGRLTFFLLANTNCVHATP